MYGEAEADEKPGSFLANLWNGDAPLVRAFWLYFALGNILWLAAILVLLVFPILDVNFQFSVPMMLAGAPIAFVIYPIYSIFTGVAVFRSGGRYARRNSAEARKRVCGRLAQFFGVAGGVLLPLLLVAALVLPL